MIAFIKGKILSKGENFVVLETGGVGYKIFCIPSIAEMAAGTEISLHTYMHVREDAQQLFGFKTEDQLDFFELLITVSGVGPKMALAILSAGDPETIKQAISAQDPAMFTKIGGVGKKTAEKIILELKDKLGISKAAIRASGSGSEDLIMALENLGYSNREIKEAITKLDHNLPTEQKLRQALKILSKK